MARLTVVNYAINGIGVGPVQRLIAINRWLQRYGPFRGDVIEPYFLTSTEAECVVFAERMAAFKIPSMQAADLTKGRYLALAKQWIWHSIGLLQPDILIVDTWPQGAFGELLNTFDLCRKRIFVYGPQSHDIAEAADFQAMLPLYDLILVPDQHGEKSRLPFGKANPERIRRMGPIISREAVELLERWEARERLGVPADRFVLYVSAGSGSDSGSQELLLSICTAVMDVSDIHLVIGGGPLYFGSVLQGPRITWLNGPSAELMRGFDAAICTAGYNSFHELQLAGVPTAWVPRVRTTDDQDARVANAIESGVTITLDCEDLRGSVVSEVLKKLRDPGLRDRIAALPSLAPRNFARDAAQAILSTLWGASEVQHAATAIDDTVLQTSIQSSLPVHALITLARWIDRQPIPSVEATRAACSLMDALIVHALHPPLGFKIVEPLCRILPADQPVGRAQAMIALLDTLACFEDWSAVIALLEALVPETTLPLERFCADFESLLQLSADQGMSLQDIVDALAAIRNGADGHYSQSDAVGSLIARLSEAGYRLQGTAMARQEANV